MPFILTNEITTEIRRFFETLFFGKENQWILLGLFDTWQSLILSTFDLAVSTLFIYFVLRLFKQSRAWQLFKGALFILAFTFISRFLGLTTISYLLSNSMSILLIGFVVIFQPELRKALEALGRSSFQLIQTATSDLNNSTYPEEQIKLIDEIYKACVNMSEQKTGALIVLERTTGLREIIDNSSTAVILDSNLTSTTLEQIFYKNSPLHDGALLIRNSRIYAARCHVPLSETVYLDGNLGTRHRAALGISEMGDAIAIVVSEERGTISAAISGKLYSFNDRADFKKFLMSAILDEEASLPNILVRLKVKLTGIQKSIRENQSSYLPPKREAVHFILADFFKRASLPVLSFSIAFFLYLFVQLSINPVETFQFDSLNLTKENALIYERAGYQIQIEDINAQVNIRARRSILDKLKDVDDTLFVSVELPKNDIKSGTFTLPLKVRSSLVDEKYYSVQSKKPASVVVSIIQTKNNEQDILPGLLDNLDLFTTKNGNVVNKYKEK